jgi:hypothetical protein
MSTFRSVNQAISQLDELRGQPVELEGVLEAAGLMPIGYELLHYPAAERATGTNKDARHRSSIWLHFGTGSVQPNRTALARWCGKRVRVHGIVYSAPEFTALSDPLGSWPAHIEVYSVQRVTKDQRRQVAGEK